MLVPRGKTRQTTAKRSNEYSSAVVNTVRVFVLCELPPAYSFTRHERITVTLSSRVTSSNSSERRVWFA